MGEWRFDGAAGRPTIWATGLFLSSIVFTGTGMVLLARAVGG